MHVGVIRNTNFRSDGSLDDSDIAFLDVEQKQFEKRSLQYGDLILEKSGGGPKQPVGRVVLFDKTDGLYSFSNFTSVIRVLDYASLDFNYLHRVLYWYYISGATEAMQRRSTGIRNLEFNAYKALDIPLPPLFEQKRIVAILDEAFAAIATAVANTEKNLDNARGLFESFLNSLFQRNEHVWVSRKLEEVCEKITVGHVGSMAKRYKSAGIPLLRSQNIRPFRVDLEKVVYIDQEFHAELKKSALRPGDLGIVRTGYPGTAAVIPHSLPVANCSDLVVVRPGDQVLSDFLAVVFNSTFGKQAVAGVLVGAAQKHFNVTSARAALMPIPSIKEQGRIVAESNEVREECEKIAVIYRRKLTSLAELKQSLLRKAFSGELTTDKEAFNATLREEEVA